jgi:hypothetical protein
VDRRVDNSGSQNADVQRVAKLDNDFVTTVAIPAQTAADQRFAELEARLSSVRGELGHVHKRGVRNADAQHAAKQDNDFVAAAAIEAQTQRFAELEARLSSVIEEPTVLPEKSLQLVVASTPQRLQKNCSHAVWTRVVAVTAGTRPLIAVQNLTKASLRLCP